MRNFALLLVATVALSACGSDPAPEPTEQIVVRDPATPPPAPAVSENATTAEVGSDAVLIAEGKAAFAVCNACHVVEAGAASTSGPNLHDVVGREAGAVEGFAYSDALKSSGITWTDAELNSYLENPAGKVPGTTMVAGAVPEAGKREAVIAYLKNASAN